MIVLTTTFNCEDYIEKSLFSIMSQTYKDFKCFITDDLSTDNTVKKINKIIENDNRFVLIENKEKKFQPGNYDQVLRNNQSIDGYEVCVEVDGDDWLPNSNVLKRINSIYENQNVWLANGSFIYHDGRKGFAKPYDSFENIRNEVFTLTHIRTWRKFLWDKIKEEDLKDDEGNYWSVAGDLSFMYPMAEMSGIEHYKFMDEINYVYNEGNPINDHKVNMNKVNQVVNKLRNKPKYEKLI